MLSFVSIGPCCLVGLSCLLSLLSIVAPIFHIIPSLTYITNSISSLGKPRMKYNNQIITKRYLSVFEKTQNYKQPYVKTSLDRRAPCKLHLH